ncbi:hypothetical protein VTN00DRAFT_6629 [Thermoascus crustaceus]|uniref:uncharacterized protein n=1 Tax=Thermoascus crustaceus TaxID=5088 RepID=UPI003743EAF3
MDMGAALNMPGLAIEYRPILDPNIEIDKLEMLYGQLTDILLQMSLLSLPPTLGGRDHQGPFKIWCDDSRPTNVLLYSNLQFPLWWPLLEQPEYWPDGIKAWTKAYDSRLQIFLKVFREREDVAIERGRLDEEQRPSGPMQESWESGDFWVAYAARKNFAFDAVFWQKLDGRFLGPEAGWESGAELLDEEERKELDTLVEHKLKQMEDRELAWEPDEEADDDKSSAAEFRQIDK